MGEALIDKLYSFHFIFTWILAIIVAVNWCYIFKLALPEYSELLAPWAIYTVLVTFLMPFVKMSLLRMQQQDGWGRKMKICQTLLISMTGTVVGTSWAGLVALVFPYVSDFHAPGPVGLTLALAVTLVFIMVQAALERALYDMSDGTFNAVSFDIILNSLWSSLGYFWNSVWNRFLVTFHKRNRRPKKPAEFMVRLLLEDQRKGPKHKFQTIQDQMNGRPDEVDNNGPGYRPLLVKAILTLSLCLVVLYFIPEPLETGHQRRLGWHRRRLWIAVKMMATIIPSYAVTDAGFYFGTQLVATKTGSEALGLCTAFAYAILMTWLVMSLARKVQWQPQGVYAGRLLGLGSWLVCYAWWYPWQEVLYQIQGYGLWNLNLDSSVEEAFQVLLTLVGALFFTILLGISLARLVDCRCLLGGSPVDSARLKELTSQDLQLRAFLERLGLAQSSDLSSLQLSPVVSTGEVGAD
ncbi:unnamed protein product [Durusdinium trenchii]|uniref:Uncharacterized protein n=2 Tax=Durusdinium trenchii TaxID=1381693 RepID=A0ABP0JKY2_9DINO